MGVDSVFRAADFLGKAHRLWDADKWRGVLRQHLRNKVRRATPAEKETLRAEKQGVTERITELRKRLKYADGIEKRSAHIDDCLDQIHDTMENQRPNRQKQLIKTDRRREELRFCTALAYAGSRKSLLCSSQICMLPLNMTV